MNELQSERKARWSTRSCMKVSNFELIKMKQVMVECGTAFTSKGRKKLFDFMAWNGDKTEQSQILEKQAHNRNI